MSMSTLTCHFCAHINPEVAKFANMLNEVVHGTAPPNSAAAGAAAGAALGQAAN